MPSDPRAILIVNPFSSVPYLFDKLSAAGYRIVVLSTFEAAHPTDKIIEHHDVVFLASKMDLEGDLARLAEIGRSLKIVHATIGSETNYLYSEQIVRALFPEASNDPATAAKRSQKYLMNEALRPTGLNFIQQLLLEASSPLEENIERALDFYRAHDGLVVVKPNADAGGSRGVFSPTSEAELVEHLKQGGDFWSNLLQEKIVGTEFLIDSVSWRGEHHFTFTGFYEKSEVAGLFKYQYIRDMDMSRPRAAKAIEYVDRALTALDFRFGLAHTEVMERDGEFYLIELNPRISGAQGTVNLMAAGNYGLDQIDVYLAILEGRPLEWSRNGLHQAIYFFKSITRENSDRLHERFTALPSYVRCLHLSWPEGRARKYMSLFDVPLFLHLVNGDADVLDADLRRVAEIERLGEVLE